MPSTPLIHLYFHSFLLLPALPAHPSPPLHNSLYSKNLPSIIYSYLRHRAGLQRWLLLKPHPNDGPRRSGGGGGKQAARQAMAYISSSGSPRLQLDSVSVGSNIARPTSRLATYTHPDSLCLLRQLSPPIMVFEKRCLSTRLTSPRLASLLLVPPRLIHRKQRTSLAPASAASVYLQEKQLSTGLYHPTHHSSTQPPLSLHLRPRSSKGFGTEVAYLMVSTIPRPNWP